VSIATVRVVDVINDCLSFDITFKPSAEFKHRAVVFVVLANKLQVLACNLLAKK
jgi:hypothetical protein